MAFPLLGWAIGSYGAFVLGRGLLAEYNSKENKSEADLLDKKAKYETASTNNNALLVFGVGAVCVAVVLLSKRK